MNLNNNEPIITANLITTLAGAILAVIVAFGVPIDLELKAALISLIAILAPVIATFWARKNSTPLANAYDVDGSKLIRLEDGQPPIAEQKEMVKAVEKADKAQKKADDKYFKEMGRGL